jgi:Helix-turn-helix domain
MATNGKADKFSAIAERRVSNILKASSARRQSLEPGEPRLSMTAPLELFTLHEVAEMFRVSSRTMREHVKRHPYFRKIGGKRLFTRADIHALYEALNSPSSSSEDRAVRTAMSAPPSQASVHARLQKLLADKRAEEQRKRFAHGLPLARTRPPLPGT